MSIIDLEQAHVHAVSPNELAFDQKDDGQGHAAWDDPIKLRFGAFDQADGKFYIAAISLDVLSRRSDGSIHRREVGMIKLAVDEMVDRDGDPVPMIAVFLAPHKDRTDDKDMDPPILLMSRKGLIVNVPMLGSSTSAISGRSSFMSDNGRYLYNVQGDPTPEYPHGRIVQYDVTHSPWKAVSILKPVAL